MPVFIKQGRSVLYVHVPKTGGCAIEAFFHKNGFRASLLDTGGAASLNRFRRCSPQHMSASQLMAVLRPATFDYVFVTVREPLARLLSEYGMHRRTMGETAPVVKWFDQTLKNYVEDPYVGDNHFRPQVEFLLPNAEVFRQEDGLGKALVNRLRERLSLEFEHPIIDQVNKGAGVKISWEDRSEIDRRVRRFYYRDYLAFGY